MAHQKRERHEVEDKFDQAAQAQRSAARSYWLNFAFLRGKQWTHVNSATGRLEEVPSDEQVRATINKMTSASRTIVSKLLQRRLQFEVSANSADDAAIEGAKLGDSILHAVHEAHQWEHLRTNFAWAMWKGGFAGICTEWDPSLGKPTALADDGRNLPSGDTRETVLSAADFVVQPGVRDAHTAQWWIKLEALPPSVVKDKYGLDAPPEGDAYSALSSLEQLLVGAHTSELGRPGLSTPLTRVLTYYERPSKSNKKGKLCVVVGGKAVFDGEWPFPFVDHLNLVVGRETELENTWMGDTTLSAARSVQAAYNSAWSNILEHLDTVGNTRMLTPNSAAELAEVYTDRIGENIVYMDGMDAPRWMEVPQIAGWILQLPQQLGAELDDILSVHAISKGSAPANIESGYGLAVLAEQDSTPIGKMNGAVVDVFSRLGTMVLKLYEDNVKEKRTAIIHMPGEPPATATWTGEDLHGQTQAHVPLELVAPRSRAAQAQFAEKAMQMQLITTLEELTRLAEMPGEREVISAVRPHVARARRENAAMAQGQVRIPENFDEHNVHITEHNHFRCSNRYEGLSPAFKDVFSNHVKAHETMAAEEAGLQQGRAAMGGPAMAAAPKADGSEAVPVEMPEGIVTGGVPLEQQTLSDQLSGDEAMAVQREQSAEDSENAAVVQQQMERDAILELANIQQGV